MRIPVWGDGTVEAARGSQGHGFVSNDDEHTTGDHADDHGGDHADDRYQQYDQLIFRGNKAYRVMALCQMMMRSTLKKVMMTRVVVPEITI